MRSNKITLSAPRLLALFLLISPIIACAGGNPLSPGAWVPEEDRIAVMDGGPHTGSWKTRDLSIQYEHQEASTNLQVKGVVKFANYIPMGYNVLEYLHVNIHLLEANGIVLFTQRIRSFSYFRSFREIGDLTFDAQYELPQDAVAFAFSYSGKVSDGGGAPGIMGSEGRTDWEFWKVLRRSPPQ